MKRLRHWKIALCLLALVLVSGLAGGLIGRRLAQVRLEQRNDPDTWNETAKRTFEHTVKPTPEQGQRIEAYLNAAVEELKTIRADTIARSTNVIWRLVSQVEKELTPEQKIAFDKMKPRQNEIATLDMLKVDPKK